MSEWIHGFFLQESSSRFDSSQNTMGAEALLPDADYELFLGQAGLSYSVDHAQQFYPKAAAGGQDSNYRTDANYDSSNALKINNLADVSVDSNLDTGLTISPQGAFPAETTSTTAFGGVMGHDLLLQDAKAERRQSELNRQMAAAILLDSSGLFLKEFLKNLASSGSIEEAFQGTLEYKIMSSSFEGLFTILFIA